MASKGSLLQARLGNKTQIKITPSGLVMPRHATGRSLPRRYPGAREKPVLTLTMVETKRSTSTVTWSTMIPSSKSSILAVVKGKTGGGEGCC